MGLTMKPKNPAHRPTKLTNSWLEAAREVLDEDTDNVLLTDVELIFLINQKLPAKERIVIRTFQRWKKRNMKGQKQLDEIGEGFVALVTSALIKQKTNLLERIRAGEQGWQGSAWIMERKFEEWNLRKIFDHQTKGEKVKQVVGFTVIAPDGTKL